MRAPHDFPGTLVATAIKLSVAVPDGLSSTVKLMQCVHEVEIEH